MKKIKKVPVSKLKKGILGTSTKYKNKAFTLVELIVTITILAILGTIGFMSFQSYTVYSRDVVRLSDLSNMKSVLEYTYTESSMYPVPDDAEEITYSGATAWYQGEFGKKTKRATKRLNEIPTDPLIGNQYTYSKLKNGNEYELGAVFEGDEVATSLQPSTFKGHQGLLRGEGVYADSSDFKAYITGNYNGKILKVHTGSTDYILAIPSIITTSINNATIEEIITNNSFSIKGTKNLPKSYGGTVKEIKKFVDETKYVIFNGDIENLKENTTLQEEITTKLAQAYSGTLTEEQNSDIQNLVNTPTSNNLFVAQSLLKSTVLKKIKITASSNTTPSTPSNSCATQLSYTHATFTTGTPTTQNQAWQNTNPSEPCYYACTDGYSGNDCNGYNFVSNLEINNYKGVSNVFYKNISLDSRDGNKIIVASTGDNKYYNYGNSSNGLIIKLDSNNNIIWKKSLSISNYSQNKLAILSSVIDTNGDIILGCRLYLNGIPLGLMVRLDENGNLLNHKVISFAPTKMVLKGDYIYAVFESVSNGTVGKINKITYAKIWVKHIKYAGLNQSELKDIVLDNTGNIYVSGNHNNSNASNDFYALLVKLDNNGNYICGHHSTHKWARLYDNIGVDNNSNIYVVSRTDGSSYYYGFIRKFDNSCNLIAQKGIKNGKPSNGDSSYSKQFDIKIDNNYIYIVGGSGGAFVYKLNTNLDYIWSKILGKTTSYFNNLLISNNKLYIIGGEDKTDSGKYKGLLVVMDKNATGINDGTQVTNFPNLIWNDVNLNSYTFNYYSSYTPPFQDLNYEVKDLSDYGKTLVIDEPNLTYIK